MKKSHMIIWQMINSIDKTQDFILIKSPIQPEIKDSCLLSIKNNKNLQKSATTINLSNEMLKAFLLRSRAKQDVSNYHCFITLD